MFLLRLSGNDRYNYKVAEISEENAICWGELETKYEELLKNYYQYIDRQL